MAYSLFGERPDVAASSSVNPLKAFGAWVANVRARHAQRVALSNLLDYDETMLKDLGIERADVIAALQNPPRRAAAELSARRARASRDWLSHP